MSAENYKISRYQCEFVNESYNNESRGVTTLYLYGDDKTMLCAMACVPGRQTFAEAQMSPNGHIAVEVGEFQMTRMIDLLRNEKPVYFSWSAETKTARVSTQEEPVGEQELRKMFSFLYI